LKEEEIPKQKAFVEFFLFAAAAGFHA